MSTPQEKLDAQKVRPGAVGHRFGPKLRCDECGTSWEAHQRDPHPCAGKCNPTRLPAPKPVAPAAPDPPEDS